MEETSPVSKPPAQDDPRVYLAAERTFLAWIRTAIALLGIGFAVARFGMYLRDRPETSGLHPALFSGLAYVVLGVCVCLYTTARYIRLSKQLQQGTWIPGKVSAGAITLALILAVVGILVTAYLIVLH